MNTKNVTACFCVVSIDDAPHTILQVFNQSEKVGEINSQRAKR